MDSHRTVRPASAGPFKAAQSYGAADDLLFYGRDADGASLAQFLADRPFAVLTAPSGTGKTSLIQAKVMPLLESERWLTVYARPRGDPNQALTAALCAHLLPDPRDEAAVVSGLIAQAPHGGSTTLQQACDWYAGRPIEERVGWRHFAAPQNDEMTPLPMVCRSLRGTIALNDLIEHFEAMVADGPALSLTPLTPLETFARQLESDEIRRFWQTWCNRFSRGAGMTAALAVFRDEWAPLRPGMSGIVIVLDQFEELFTQFPAGTIDQFLSDMATWSRPHGNAPFHRPLNVTLALRKEFFADMVPYLGAFGSVERLAYFLGPMTAEQARDALGKPAGLFGIGFAPATSDDASGIGCLAKVLSLAVEDGSSFSGDEFRGAGAGTTARHDAGRFAPTLISLIGAHLFVKLQVADPPAAMPLTWEAFQRLIPNLDDVFMRFLDDALGFFDDPGRPAGSASRFDALELLDHLVTSTGYRNIVAEVELIDRLPIPTATAVALLDDMDQHLKLVRRECRGRGRFVEIMHERLIVPVRRLLAESRRRDILRAALGPAHDMIHLLPDDPDPTRDPMPSPHLREALVEHLERTHLDRLAAKHLLRSMLCAGPDREGRTDGGDDSPRSWKKAVVTLAGRLEDRSRDDPQRLPLLAESELELAITAADADETALEADRLRHVAISALADKSEAAGERIRRTFSTLARKGYVL